VGQAENNPGQWMSYLSEQVRYLNGMYELRAYKRTHLPAVFAAEPAIGILCNAAMEEVVDKGLKDQI
jgi:hypothetical protein